MAMKKGLERFLIPDNFTSVGKMRVKTPKYNTPKDLYSDDTMDDMVCGSTVDPTKLDPECDAYKKWAKSKRFDPARSGVMEVLRNRIKEILVWIKEPLKKFNFVLLWNNIERQ